MKSIPIKSKGEVIANALIDDEYFNVINRYNWHLHNNRYARTSIYIGIRNGKQIQSKVYMHRMVMELSGVSLKNKDYIDHISGAGLDNRIINLRTCTMSQNLANSKFSVINTSGFKGVSWSKKDKKWVAQITYKYKHIYLGGFNLPEEAARAYDQAAKKYFGVFAYTNEAING